MEKTELESWRGIYTALIAIGRHRPWDRFREKDPFVFQAQDRPEPFFFSFLSDSAGQCGIACYDTMEAYVRARARLRRRGQKDEPSFFLQDAVVCLWGNESELSAENLALLEELQLKPQGDNAWLHCQWFREGFWPIPVQGEETLSWLRTALENLLMMVRTVIEKGLDPKFELGNMLMRRWDARTQQYITFAAKNDIPQKPEYPELVVYQNEFTKEMRETAGSGSTYALDWSYLPVRLQDEETEVIPRLLLAVDRDSGEVLRSDLFSPMSLKYSDVLDLMAELFREKGRPSGLLVSDRELEACLAGFARECGIPLKYQSVVPQIEDARRRTVTIDQKPQETPETVPTEA